MAEVCALRLPSWKCPMGGFGWGWQNHWFCSYRFEKLLSVLCWQRTEGNREGWNKRKKLRKKERCYEGTISLLNLLGNRLFSFYSFLHSLQTHYSKSNTWEVPRLLVNVPQLPAAMNRYHSWEIKLLHCQTTKEKPWGSGRTVASTWHRSLLPPSVSASCFKSQQVKERWYDLSGALFWRPSHRTRCESKPKRPAVMMCHWDLLQTGSSHYHSSAHSTAEDSTETSWRPRLEAQPLKAALDAQFIEIFKRSFWRLKKICLTTFLQLNKIG